MLRTTTLLAIVALEFVFGSSAHAQLVAFPGAEGAGQYAIGGRGGDVYHVTNLNDSGLGSLRFGVDNAAGPRTIVFDVGGTIDLSSRIRVDSSNITIAGQTAPGDGITLKGYHFEVRNATDVVVRYIRSRPGDIHTVPSVYEPDSIGIINSQNVILDHVSASWSTDEVLSPTSNSGNVTVQWSMISEALHNSNHSKGNHGYGSLINGGDYTFHHNLYAHNRSRNPRPQEGGDLPTRLDFVNNVIYNPGDKYGYGGGDEEVFMNFVGNYGISGPNTTENDLYVASSLENVIYQSGNFMDLNRNGVLDGQSNGLGDFDGTFTQSGTRFDLPLVTTQTAPEALAAVLDGAGASLARDAVDARVINTVLSYGTLGAHLNSQSQVGGWPALASGVAPLDTDQDGMSDEYEEVFGLNKLDNSDRNAIGSNGYTVLENYLNFLAAGLPIPSLAGDYNNDDAVDAADYTVWRDALNSNSPLQNETASFGVVDAADYDAWKANFGAVGNSGSGANTPVPEPHATVLLLTACVSTLRRRR